MLTSFEVYCSIAAPAADDSIDILQHIRSADDEKPFEEFSWKGLS